MRRDHLDLLLRERGANEVAGNVVPERRRHRCGKPEPRGSDGRDGAAPRRTQERPGKPLLAERRQRLQTDERQIQEDGGRDNEVDHARARINPIKPLRGEYA